MKKNKGVTMGLALIIAAVLAILVLSMANQVSKTSDEMIHFDNMYKTFRLAETGFGKAAGIISIAPESYGENPIFTQEQTVADGKINASAKIVTLKMDDNPLHDVSAYYVVTNATRISGGRKYSAQLHTYARISNIGEYFAAVRNDLKISYPIDAEKGKVYASRLEFETLPPSILTEPSPSDTTKTKVLSAEYFESITPQLPVDRTNPSDPYYANGRLFKRSVIINGDKDNLPQKLVSPLLFPQITVAELDFYKNLAKGKTNNPEKCKFNFESDGSMVGGVKTVNIYPPGYYGNKSSLDKNPNHTNSNEDHVYYCPKDIYIEGVIHGQVLFVTPKNIYITSDLVSEDLSSDASGTYPGHSSNPDTSKNSSTAHQAILIAGEDVIIKKFPEIEKWKPDEKSTDIKTVQIHAMILAPNGKFDFEDSRYDSIVLLQHLALDFTGSTVLSKGPSFAQTFMAKRTYKYMDSLKTNPPPYLPALIDVYHSVEKTIASGDPVH